MPTRKPPPPPDDEDIEDEDVDDDVDDDESDDDDGEDDEDEDDESSDDEDDEEIDAEEIFSGDDEEPPNAPKSNGSARGGSGASARVRARRDPHRARGAGGMGRPSTGPRQRAAARTVGAAAAAASAEPSPDSDVMNVETPETELAPDISSWPGTSEAAKLVGRHTSTVKLWRQQGRIRALQDASNCWRYHPDDLAEAVETPDATDPASVLASGMTAIVQQGAQANGRLLAMTELTTDGLKETVQLLREELKRVYIRNDHLEKLLSAEREKNITTHSEDLKHERYMRRLDQRHEVTLAGAHETSARLNGLLQVLGPIAASIGARLLGDIVGAEKAEAAIASGTAAVASSSPAASSPESAPQTPKPSAEDRLVPLETRIIDAMARLSEAIRKLDTPAFQGLRAMMPAPVAEALDAVIRAENDGTVGKALAVIVQAAQNLSDLQFAALKPIAPLDIATVLAELRVMLREQG